jgi:hypothetical protein
MCCCRVAALVCFGCGASRGSRLLLYRGGGGGEANDVIYFVLIHTNKVAPLVLAIITSSLSLSHHLIYASVFYRVIC